MSIAQRTQNNNPLRLFTNLSAVISAIFSIAKINRTKQITTVKTAEDIYKVKQIQAQQAHTALSSAIRLLGGQVSLAKSVGVSQGRVSVWLNRDKKVPFDQVIAIEHALKNIKGNTITRYDLRPDIYGAKPTVKSLVSQAFNLSITNSKTYIKNRIYAVLRSPFKLTISILVLVIGTTSLQTLTNSKFIDTTNKYEFGMQTTLNKQSNDLNNSNLYGTNIYSDQSCVFGVNN